MIGRAQPRGPADGEPALAGSGHQIQRPELVEADHPPVARWLVVQGEDAVLLGGEVRIVRVLPGLRALKRDPCVAKDLPDRLVADPDVGVRSEVVAQLGQAPTGERAAQPGRVGLGRAADLLTHRRADPRHRPTACFWVQCREPPIVERPDQLAHRFLLRGEHHRDLRHRPALHRRQRHPGPPHPHPIPRRPRDLHQPLRLVRIQLTKEDLWLSRHATPPPASASNTRAG